MPPQRLNIRGARRHNLEIDQLELPLAGMTVFVGPSGSGKTSLALHTLHAESRRRLTNALGSQSAGHITDHPGSFANLPVTLAVSDQQRVSGHHRVIDLLGLTGALVELGLRGGVVHCSACDRALPVQSSDEIADALLAEETGSRLVLLAPVARARVGGISRLVTEIARQGFVRVALDGELFRIEDLPTIDARLAHDLDVVVDRVRISPDRRERLDEAIGTALAAGNGRLIARFDAHDRAFSERPWCPDHPADLEAPRAEWLAGGPGGRCVSCDGSGSDPSSSDPSSGDANKHCPACLGSGLRPELRGLHLPHSPLPWPKLLAAPLSELLAGLPTLGGPALAEQIHDFGLGHLLGTARSDQLSSTELRRLRVLAALRTAQSIPGLLLILDEPLAGLPAAHAVRISRHLQTQQSLVITHHRSLAELADYAVAFGPGAGHNGGRVVWQGLGAKLPVALLPPEPSLNATTEQLAPVTGPALSLGGPLAATPGLAGLSCPHGALTVITGPPGSGRSRLLGQTLEPAVRLALGLTSTPALPHGTLSGTAPFERLLTFERTPAGRSARSSVATVLGIWTPLRQLLAATRDARILGLDASRFRFDVAGGRCESCQGTGLSVTAVAAQGLLAQGEAVEACPVCDGKRFQLAVLRVRLKGRTVSELLSTDIEEAAGLFAALPKLGPALSAARLVGLGYLPLAQPAATLSGGESQRLRLARELARSGGMSIGQASRLSDRLVLLDGPTVGLHPHDVGAVVEVLKRLSERGATVVVASVSPALVAAADHVVELPAPA